MDDSTKREAGRFPLRMPADVDKAVRALANGDSAHPPAGINDTILFLIRRGLETVREEKQRQAA